MDGQTWKALISYRQTG